MKLDSTDTPLVSVIVPVYNGERFLDEAVRSILRQDYRPLEIIVVDDGSTDATAQIAQSFEEVRYLHQPNQGPSAALNRGIDAARGELLAFLPADDLWVSNKLNLQVRHLLDHPEDEFVTCHQRAFFQEGFEPPPWALHPVYQKPSPCFVFGALLAKRAVFDRVGGYNPDFRFGENAEWMSRAKHAGIRYTVLPEPLLLLRIHERNATHLQTDMRSGVLSALKASIDRKRKAAQNGATEDDSSQKN